MFAALVTSVVLGACATIGQSPAEEAKQVVSRRAMERWDLLLKAKADEAYQYFSPATRSTVTLDSFRKRSGGGRWWRTINMESVVCEPEVCTVTLVLTYDIHELKGLKAGIEEKWVKDEGSWFLVSTK